MLIGCSTSKKVTVVKKVDVPVGLPAKEVLTEVEGIAKVEVQKAVDTTVFQAFRELAPEEKIAEQKRMGIYKGADWAAAIHYDLRKPNFVIIHHTAQNSIAQTVRTFQVPHSKVSAHYVIGRDGQIIQMLNDYERAWHAGKSKWGNIDDLRSHFSYSLL